MNRKNVAPGCHWHAVVRRPRGTGRGGASGGAFDDPWSGLHGGAMGPGCPRGSRKRLPRGRKVFRPLKWCLMVLFLHGAGEVWHLVPSCMFGVHRPRGAVSVF